MTYNCNYYKRISFLAVLLVLVLSVSAAAARAPKNIILLIGDGMGMGHVTAARIAEGGPDYRLTMEKLPYAAIVNTHSANSLVTDSAASATALSTGVKTNNGMVGMTPDKEKARTILEAAQGIRKATGLVTSVTITHATPACFASHVEARGDEVGIAEQLAVCGADVLMGGGLSRFIPQEMEGSARKDSKNLVEQMKARGYTLVENRDALLSTSSSKILGLFWTASRPGDSFEPSLADMTGKAIETLNKNRNGFFLMVEGGQIDYEAHGNRIRGTINQMIDFDKAVASAVEFAQKDGNTLVVVTADHDTGGLAIKNQGLELRDRWIDGGHSGNPVPLYAYGPSAELFTGVMDNTDIPNTFARLWKVQIGR